MEADDYEDPFAITPAKRAKKMLPTAKSLRTLSKKHHKDDTDQKKKKQEAKEKESPNMYFDDRRYFSSLLQKLSCITQSIGTQKAVQRNYRYGGEQIAHEIHITKECAIAGRIKIQFSASTAGKDRIAFQAFSRRQQQ